MTTEHRFVGQIAGFGTASGTRVVLGHWWESPFGAFADAMVEQGDGHRTLLAPVHVAEFVSSTYTFDEVVHTPVTVRSDAAASDDHDGHLVVAGGPLAATLTIGGRTGLGHLLRLVPAPLATSPAFSRVTDPVARVLLRGVRTRGSAGGGRTEIYGATDVRVLRSITASWDGADLGEMRDVVPPVRFGFGSSPPRPCITRLVTTVTTATD
ncbi:hypothetical protein [Paraoerskovia marina]|uniref:hypothetical protein n=1 Tax=Paraoerskovia marina TaxID=545619 RepID=UPI00049239E3|nr:hypothetical protein [Paraoerskovia marina]